ncbi:hypothetical protein RvY_00937 [Ramazzottius varieornatus]|uniref:Uncharacterized protein n=1 Tax=Ramazzottius varieornatus TaxID=947166 RepID=A0A1D1UPB3_RAMVA|nr:hypothetical protein RvY_00937 [Ramazzottius varieornatus]
MSLEVRLVLTVRKLVSEFKLTILRDYDDFRRKYYSKDRIRIHGELPTVNGRSTDNVCDPEIQSQCTVDVLRN